MSHNILTYIVIYEYIYTFYSNPDDAIS